VQDERDILDRAGGAPTNGRKRVRNCPGFCWISTPSDVRRAVQCLDMLPTTIVVVGLLRNCGKYQLSFVYGYARR